MAVKNPSEKPGSVDMKFVAFAGVGWSTLISGREVEDDGKGLHSARD